MCGKLLVTYRIYDKCKQLYTKKSIHFGVENWENFYCFERISELSTK